MFDFYNSISDLFKWGESNTYQLAKSFTFMHWRRKWQPTPVFLPGESHGQSSLVGCRLWGHTESGHDWSDLAAAAAASSWNSQNKKHFLNPSVIYFQLSSSQTKMVSYFFLSILSSFSFAHWFFSHIEIHCKTYRKFNKLQVRLIQRPISRHVIIKLSKNKKNL